LSPTILLGLELVSKTSDHRSLAGLDSHPLFPKLDRKNLNAAWAGTVLDGLKSAQPSSAFVAAGFEACDALLRAKWGTPGV